MAAAVACVLRIQPKCLSIQREANCTALPCLTKAEASTSVAPTGWPHPIALGKSTKLAVMVSALRSVVTVTAVTAENSETSWSTSAVPSVIVVAHTKRMAVSLASLTSISNAEIRLPLAPQMRSIESIPKAL